MEKISRVVKVNPLLLAAQRITNNLGVNRYGNFLPRRESEQELLRKIENDNYITLVYGNGGIGKSALTFNLMSQIVKKNHLFSKEIDKVFWFSDSDHPGDLTLEKIISEIKFTCGMENSSKYNTLSEEIAIISKLFSEDKISIIVIDNFETIKDNNIFEFIFNNPPTGCKIILTSKYNLEYYIDHHIISNKLSESISEINIPKFTFDEWKLIFEKKCEDNGKIKEWRENVQKSNPGNSLNEILKKVYEALDGNVFGMQTIISQIAKRNIWEINAIEKILSEDSVMNTVFGRILDASWELLSQKAQAVIIASMMHGPAILNFDIIEKLCSIATAENGLPKIGSELEKSVYECVELNLMEKDYESRKTVFYLSPLVHQFVSIKFKNNDLLHNDLDTIIRNWIEYYKTLSKDIGFCYNDTKKMQILDIPSNRSALMFLLDYCYDEKKYDDFVYISNELRYFFYTRAIWKIGDDCIHIKRALASLEIGKYVDEFEALVYYINIACKYKHLEGIQKYINRAEEISKIHQLSNESLFRYKHAMGLYFYAKKDYDTAMSQWNYILDNPEEKTANEHDLSAAKRWKLKCLLEMKNISSEKIIEYCNELLEESKKQNFEREIIDLTLMIVCEYLKMDDFSNSTTWLESIEDLISVTNDFLYKARFNLYAALLKGATNEGIAYFKNSIKIFKELNIKNELYKFKNSIMNIYEFNEVLKKNDFEL